VKKAAVDLAVGLLISHNCSLSNLTWQHSVQLLCYFLWLCSMWLASSEMQQHQYTLKLWNDNIPASCTATVAQGPHMQTTSGELCHSALKAPPDCRPLIAARKYPCVPATVIGYWWRTANSFYILQQHAACCFWEINHPSVCNKVDNSSHQCRCQGMPTETMQKETKRVLHSIMMHPTLAYHISWTPRLWHPYASRAQDNVTMRMAQLELTTLKAHYVCATRTPWGA
jgi:hypothetical protein